MSISDKVVFAIAAVSIVASIPIVNRVSEKINSLPVATPISIPTALKKIDSTEASSSSSSKSLNQYALYFIALDDGGKQGRKIGCNDSLVPVLQRETGTKELTNEQKVSQLLNYKSSIYVNSKLYNSLAKSNLKVVKSQVFPNGTQEFYLEGTLSVSGACDVPRIIEQISATANQGKSDSKVKLFYNDMPLEQVLTTK